MRISDRGLALIARHEGFVARAYRDPVGVLTIGYGFTMGSRVFAAYWRDRHGRALAPGDRLERAEADALLRRLVDGEYGAAVTRELGELPQHQHDAACSVAFNLGPRALRWRWARALKAGDRRGAAEILGANYNTAGGRRLAGLVRRRREEAALLLAGDYGDGGAGEGNPVAAPEAGNRSARARRGLWASLVSAFGLGAAGMVESEGLSPWWIAGAAVAAIIGAGVLLLVRRHWRRRRPSRAG
ncbi:lysozyme [Stappia sp. MMSF_3263]|uniref:lysozyme n=1 Tax=Stappia sp. MMSF_3263 TaxID=3046693 RepID=UPI00274026D0|nr:lysozyme [Stappia sp. MMSF_3263]